MNSFLEGVYFVRATKREAEEHEEEFDALTARVIQHEYDHLHGVLFTDYIKGLKKQMLRAKLLNISKGMVKTDYRMKYPDKK